jgi:hypothetical protein
MRAALAPVAAHQSLAGDSDGLFAGLTSGLIAFVIVVCIYVSCPGSTITLSLPITLHSRNGGDALDLFLAVSDPRWRPMRDHAG